LGDFEAKIVDFRNKSMGYFKNSPQSKAFFHFITTFALLQHTKFTMTPMQRKSLLQCRRGVAAIARGLVGASV
jgi:hypothetical protein